MAGWNDEPDYTPPNPQVRVWLLLTAGKLALIVLIWR